MLKVGAGCFSAKYGENVGCGASKAAEKSTETRPANTFTKEIALPTHGSLGKIPTKFLKVLAAGILLTISSGARGQAPVAGRVLQVGTYQGKAGQYSTIQAAVNAAQPGDWILIGPGTYPEKGAADAACGSRRRESICGV